MRRHAWAMGWILSVAVMSAVGDSATQPADDRGVAWEQYRVLMTRNIFLQDRKQSLQTRPASTQPSVRSEESSLVLTGVAGIGPDRAAYFEDLRTGETTRISAGQAMHKGRVVLVTMEGVEYEQEGSIKRIAIGQDLTGSAAAMGATTSPAGGSAADGASGGGNADPVLERLRQRRAQEIR